MSQEDVDMYLKYPAMFFSDFFESGNEELNIAVYPRNVESGIWFEATWKNKQGEKRHAEAQRMRLMWERVIKRFLSEV